jgi:O-antigen/teichoic acid export membrane protein
MNFIQLLIRLSSISVITSVLMLFMSLILGRIMDKSDFGEYSVLQSSLMIFQNFAAMGAGLAISVFMYNSPARKIKAILNNVFFFILPVFFVLSLLLIFAYSLCKGRFEYEFFIVILNVILMAICMLGIDYLRMKQDLFHYSKLFLVYTLCISMFSVLGYYFGRSVFYLYSAVFMALIFPSYHVISMFSKEYNISFSYKKKLKTYMWSLKYGLPVVSSTVVMSFLVIGDKVILSQLVNKSELAEYSIAAVLASTSLFLVNNFASAWGVFIFKKLSTLNRGDVFDFYFSSMKWLLLAVPISLVFYFFQYLIYVFFYSSKYEDLGLTIFILTSSYFLLGMSKYFMGFINFFNKNYFIFYAASFSSFFMCACSILVFDYNVLNMAVSVLLSMSSFLMMMFFITTLEVRKYAHT